MLQTLSPHSGRLPHSPVGRSEHPDVGHEPRGASPGARFFRGRTAQRSRSCRRLCGHDSWRSLHWGAERLGAQRAEALHGAKANPARRPISPEGTARARSVAGREYSSRWVSDGSSRNIDICGSTFSSDRRVSYDGSPALFRCHLPEQPQKLSLRCRQRAMTKRESLNSLQANWHTREKTRSGPARKRRRHARGEVAVWHDKCHIASHYGVHT